MSNPCEQRETIQEMAAVIGALRSLPDAIRDMQSDFKKMLDKLQESIADGREYRTLIQQNSKSIEDLRTVDHEQWEELAALGKRVDESCRRVGERLESLEKWQAGLDGGKPGGAAERLGRLDADNQQEKGRRKLWAAVPVLISLLALVMTYLK